MTDRPATRRRPAPPRRVALALLALLAACGDQAPPGTPPGTPPAAPAAPASAVSGRYRLEPDDGSTEFLLEEKGGVVTVTSSGGTATGRVVAPGRIEGRDEVEGRSATFVFEVKGDDLVARFSVEGPSGESIDLPVLTFRRVAAGAAGTASGDAAPSAGPRDGALPGHWRHTEARASGGFTMATDHHLVLEADGRYATWTRSASSLGTSEGERATGVWETKDGVLRLRPDGGSWAESRYQLSGDTMLRTYPSGDKAVYERL